MKTEKILIVDDEPLTRVMMRKALEGEGYRVSAVRSAGEALRQAGEENFDLVLADIVIPDNGGLELVEELRRVSPDIIPLLIRDYQDIETARAAMRVGVYDCIVDPLERSELCTTVARALRRRWLIKEALRRRRLIDGDSLCRGLAGFIRSKKSHQRAAAS